MLLRVAQAGKGAAGRQGNRAAAGMRPAGAMPARPSTRMGARSAARSMQRSLPNRASFTKHHQHPLQCQHHAHLPSAASSFLLVLALPALAEKATSTESLRMPLYTSHTPREKSAHTSLSATTLASALLQRQAPKPPEP